MNMEIKVIVAQDDSAAIAFVEQNFAKCGCPIATKNLIGNCVFVCGNILRERKEEFLRAVFPDSLPPLQFINRIKNVLCVA